MGALFSALSFIPGPWLVWIRIGLYVACFGAGLWTAHKFHQAEQARAVNEARAAERDVVAIGNSAERVYLERMRKQKEQADATLSQLRRRLARAPRCDVPVPVDFMREPAGVSGAAGDPAGARSAGPPVAADLAGPVADCRAVVETCSRNKADVCDPNAEQLDALRAWYRDVRERYNRSVR